MVNPMYYQQTPISEKPEKLDLYHVILEPTETNAQPKGVALYNPDSGKWSKSNITHWFKPCSGDYLMSEEQVRVFIEFDRWRVKEGYKFSHMKEGLCVFENRYQGYRSTAELFEMFQNPRFRGN